MPNPFRPFAVLALLAAVAGCTGAPNVVALPPPVLPGYVPPVAAVPTPYYDPTPVAPVQTPLPYQPVAPAQALVAYGANCSAGFYRCLLPAAGVIGSQCSCPGIGAPSYGVVEQ